MTKTRHPGRRPWFPSLRRRGGPRKPRLVGIDAVRGLAVVGMVFAHAGYVGEWGRHPSALIGIAHGHSSILFAVVAGLSLGMITGGATPPSGTRLLQIRLRIGGRVAALLLLSGLLSILPSTVAVILASYALWFVLAIPCLRWRPRWLLVAGVLHLVLGKVVADTLLFLLSFAEIHPFGSPEDFVPTLLLSGAYPAAYWMGFVLIGLAIARCGIRETTALTRFAVAGLCAFVLASLPFVVKEGSLSPVFSASEKGSETVLIEETILFDWCLDPDGQALTPCTVPEYEEQAATFTDEEAELYWLLYDAIPHEELTELCLDLDREALYWCTPEEFETQQATLTPEQQQLLLRLQLGEIGGAFDDYVKLSIFTLQPHSGSMFETLASGGLAVFLVAGFALLDRIRAARLTMLPLAAVGAMALTSYAAHIVVLAYVPSDGSSNLYATYLALALVVGCAIWRAVFVAGPLENFTGALSDRAATLADPRKG